MAATTVPVSQPRPGRSGGYKSLRRAGWENLSRARTLVATVEDQVQSIAACQAFTAAISEYRLILSQAPTRW